MKNFKFVSLIALALMAATGLAAALSKEDIQFPVAELDNCADQTSCRALCDRPENQDRCLAFAEKYGLISGENAARARKIEDLTGPGGCRGKDCKIYCEDISHLRECLAFGREHGLISETEAASGEKLEQFIKEGGRLPGACETRECLESRCHNPSTREDESACLNLAEKMGFVQPAERERIERLRRALETDDAPCRSREECGRVCAEDFERCEQFFRRLGFGEEMERPALEDGHSGQTGEMRERMMPERPEMMSEELMKRGIMMEEDRRMEFEEMMEMRKLEMERQGMAPEEIEQRMEQQQQMMERSPDYRMMETMMPEYQRYQPNPEMMPNEMPPPADYQHQSAAPDLMASVWSLVQFLFEPRRLNLR